ncbi:hypothetical protein BSLG_005809 [Batrachochytrium salamandrivorans]|nr:hypothetical protein BSLG_005809 [Batrachochytrium salamandrivorans]
MYRGDRKGLAVSAISDDQYHDVGTDKYLLEETGLKFEDDESNSPDEQKYQIGQLYSIPNLTLVCSFCCLSKKIDVSDDDPDDPIIQVMPVYISNELTESLYLMQFPTRPIPFTRDVQPTAGRIKYNTNRVQLDIALDKESAHYDWNTGERFGQGPDNKPIATAYDLANRDDRQDSGTMLDHIKMDSKMVPLNAQYMVSVVQDDDGTYFEDKDAARRASLAEIQRNLDNEAWTTLSIYDVEVNYSNYALLSIVLPYQLDFYF